MTNNHETIHLGLSCEIIFWRGKTMTNNHETIHLGLSCDDQSYEPNMIHI